MSPVITLLLVRNTDGWKCSVWWTCDKPVSRDSGRSHISWHLGVSWMLLSALLNPRALYITVLGKCWCIHAWDFLGAWHTVLFTDEGKHKGQFLEMAPNQESGLPSSAFCYETTGQAFHSRAPSSSKQWAYLGGFHGPFLSGLEILRGDAWSLVLRGNYFKPNGTWDTTPW